MKVIYKSILSVFLLLISFNNGFCQVKLDRDLIIDKTTFDKTNKLDYHYTYYKPNSSFFVDINQSAKLNKEHFFNQFKKEHNLGKEFEFKLFKTQKDNIGYTHYRYQQYYKGIKVEGGEIIIHENSGFVESVNGHLFNELNLGVKPKLNTELAIKKAKEFYGIKKMTYENPDAEEYIKLLNEDNNATYKPIPELIITADNYDSDDKKFYLAYKMNIAADEQFINEMVYINSITGKIVSHFSEICSFSHISGEEKAVEKSNINYKQLINFFKTDNATGDMVNGTAHTLYSGNQTFQTEQMVDGTYRLRDNSRGKGIITYDLRDTSTSQNDFINDSNTWGEEIFLKKIRINSILNNDLWEDPFEKEIFGNKPDLFIIIKNINGDTLYKSRVYDQYVEGLNIPVNFIMKDEDYLIEIYDEDLTKNDFIGVVSVKKLEGLNNYDDSTLKINISCRTTKAKNPALDIQWGLQKAFDFFNVENIFNFHQNANSQTIAFINVGLSKIKSQNEAFYSLDGNGIYLGLGDQINYSPRVDIDVVGHEYLHKQKTFAISTTESSSLSESFGDIFGTLIEHYSGKENPNWHVAEDSRLNLFPFQRSLDNPSSDLLYDSANDIDIRCPDTYKGLYWNFTDFTKEVKSNDLDDAAHTNCGVQNFWFYLLCANENMEGTNDLGNYYNVSPIGINKAKALVYYNLFTELGNYYANYRDSAEGSIKVAERFVRQGQFNFNQSDIDQIRNAWYAVGVLSDPTKYCTGTTIITQENGTLDDGSGDGLYFNNSDCKWLIKPNGASTITINFEEFKTFIGDEVTIYDGETTDFPVLYGPISGDVIPPTITSTSGAVLINFTTNGDGEARGWKLNYQANLINSYCKGREFLNTSTGSFNDGSEEANYAINANCEWLISPPGASSIQLAFSEFDTEESVDKVIIYDAKDRNTDTFWVYSGSEIPQNIPASSTGQLFVVFESNSTVQKSGWTASYTSIGSPHCEGLTTLTESSGVISDGSGEANYFNNSDCTWLIQPPNASSITLEFTEFELELGAPEGNSFYDWVAIYDGEDQTNLIGRFSGENMPPSITSTSGSMFILFHTNDKNVAAGWSASYTSKIGEFCAGTTILKEVSGSFSDGSIDSNYLPNSRCSWLIQPENATSIILNFSEFDTEFGEDGIIIYDGSFAIPEFELGRHSGNLLPNNFISTGGFMLIKFVSNGQNNFNGWTANYTANISPEGVTGSINKYEYWFDEDYSNKVTTSIAAVNTSEINSLLSTESLNEGMHKIHIRFKDKLGQWSSVSSEFFTKHILKNATSKIVNYEYWFNDNYENKISIAVIPNQIINLDDYIDAKDLTIGMHTLHLRFKDENGFWSSVNSGFIYREKLVNSDNVVTSYRYWFNSENTNLVVEEYSAKKANEVSQKKMKGKFISNKISASNNVTILEKELSTSDLIEDTTNTFHIQFKDKNNQWSSVLSTEFYKCGVIPEPTVLIDGDIIKSSPSEGYSWYLNGELIEGETSQEYTVSEDGNYSVIITNINGCQAVSNQINFSALSVEDFIEEFGVNVFPNPSNGILKVSNPKNLNGKLEVYDMLGRQVIMDHKLSKTIDLTSYSRGIYFIRIIIEDKVFVKNIVIE